jgi:outer membrane protein OmpA-like peptidoglycan-associated protein
VPPTGHAYVTEYYEEGESGDPIKVGTLIATAISTVVPRFSAGTEGRKCNKKETGNSFFADNRAAIASTLKGIVERREQPLNDAPFQGPSCRQIVASLGRSGDKGELSTAKCNILAAGGIRDDAVRGKETPDSFYFVVNKDELLEKDVERAKRYLIEQLKPKIDSLQQRLVSEELADIEAVPSHQIAIVIAGHASPEGEQHRNVELSTLRADTIRRIVKTQLGEVNILMCPYAFLRPACPQVEKPVKLRDRNTQMINRRVQIGLVEIDPHAWTP